VPKVRLIDAEGEQAGIVDIETAMAKAREATLDLVEISPNAEPPVCKIMDHGRFKFEMNKKQHSAKKKQKQVQIKEIKFRPGTDQADYDVKMRNLVKFLENGDKTKITLRFRGREMAHRELGAKLLKRVEADLSEYATVEQFPKMEGRQMVMVMAPHKNKPKSEGGGGASDSGAAASSAPKAAASKPAAAKPADSAAAEAAARQAAEDEAVRAAEAQVQAQVAARQANQD